MPFLRPVNLPLPLIVQSISSVGLGLYLTFFRCAPFSIESYSMAVPLRPTPRVADSISLLGITLTALESAYLITSYMPFTENQFVACSIPIRLYVAAALGSLCLFRRKELTSSGFWEFLGLAILDGVSAIWLGTIYGRYDGMVVGAEKWLS